MKMKLLVLTSLILLASITLSAQDTLYVKGEETPLLIKITTADANYLNYIDANGTVSQIEMRNIKEVRVQSFFVPVKFEEEKNDLEYALDTLYLKDAEEPLLVNLLTVKKKSLNYNKSKGGLIYTVRMKNVENIRFRKLPSEVYPEFDEFQSTISINTRILRRYYVGVNYLGRIRKFQSKKKRVNFFTI